MKETSHMIILPENEKDIDLEVILTRLSDWKDIKLGEILEREVGNEFVYDIPLCIDEREYTVTLSLQEVEIPEFFRTIHAFSDEEFERLENVEYGLGVEMDYSKHFLTSYHDQLKIMNTLVPHQLAVMDIPAERLISGRWVKFAAQSQVPPSPEYLFTIQAISDNGGAETWLHTHGLKRCGLPELEILGSCRDMYSGHYSVIKSLAMRMIEDEEALNLYEPMFLSWVSEDVALIATIVNWRDGLKYYPKITIGGEDDRDEYHSEDTCVIMLYRNPSDIDKRKLTQVQVLNGYLEKNPIFFYTNSETERMRKLAQERIDYVRRIMQNTDKEVHVLLKIGLDIDEEFRDPDDDSPQKEHIWFELRTIKKELFKEVFVCELTQKPYYVKKMDVGSVGKYKLSDITDWLIYVDNQRYTPDDVYMLDD